MTSSRTP